MQKKAKRSVFWQIYVILIFLVIAAIAAGLVYLWQVMDDYEKSTPEFAMQNLNEIFNEQQYNLLAENSNIQTHVYESNDVRSEILQQKLLSGELKSVRMAQSEGENTLEYQVNAGDEKIGNFKLVYIQEGMFGHWIIEKPQITPIIWGDITLRAPSTSQVFVNGVQISPDDILQNDIAYNVLQKLPQDQGLIIPTQTEYHIKNFEKQPEILVVDDLGNEHNVVLKEKAPWQMPFEQSEQTAENTQYYGIAQLAPPNEDLAALSEMTLRDAENYSRYLSNDNAFSTLAVRLMPYTDIYAEMRAMETLFYTPHTHVSFTDATTENIKRYNDDIFSIDAKYVYTVYRGADRPYIFDTNLTFIYVRSGENWLIGDIRILS